MNTNKCYFCSSKNLVFTNEHYIFCRDCMALYTFMEILESNCKHISNNTPVCLHAPVYKILRNRRPYIVISPENRLPEQYCSICTKKCIADGW